MSAGSQRRRSGVWESDLKSLEKESSRRFRWGHDRQKKEPTAYDEWIAHEKQKDAARTSGATRTRPSPLTRSTTGGSTIRAVTPETDLLNSVAPERNLMSFERGSAPHTTTVSTVSNTVSTLVSRTKGGSHSSASASKGRKLIKEREGDREARLAQTTSPSSSKSASNGTSFLSRRGSGPKRNGQRPSDVMPDHGASASRPRTRTLDERSTEPSPAMPPITSRSRMGSLQAASPPKYPGGAEYLASVPASTQAPAPPSISSPESLGRAISPMSSGTADSISSALPNANTRRIMHLMKTLNGIMSGNIVFRRSPGSPWSHCYAYVHEETKSLLYESRVSEGTHKTLIKDLSCWTVGTAVESNTPYLELKNRTTGEEAHLRVQTQTDFDAWFAALLHWQPVDARTTSRDGNRSESEMSGKFPPIPRQVEWSAPYTQRDRAGSSKSEQRKSLVTPTTTQKENPVIKIGKMIYWDTSGGHGDNPMMAALHGQPMTSRPQAFRMPSVSSRRWRRISGQLRENGELKLHSDSDNSLITVIQLSQLSRCAIQRLDPSVLGNDFSIAIYPQYTATYTSNPQGIIRPIFLSLENRVLHEVWYVLLRAFTMPSIYGPRIEATEPEESGDNGKNHDLESMIATSTTYTFRMERSLHVRIVEARMMPANANTLLSDSGNGTQSRGQTGTNAEKHGYYADVLLDNETRGKTVVKYGSLSPLWGESFDFQDLPPVLNSASVIVKRRPADSPASKGEGRIANDAYSSAGDPQGGFTTHHFDVTCGKVEMNLDELDSDKDVEKWWPLLDMYGQRVGEVLIRVRAEEGIILMARDYHPLSRLVHRFTNGLTSQIAELIPQELKRLSDCLLNIFQVSGKAGEWLMALVEEEIDGIDKDSPISRLRYNRRANSNESGSTHGLGSSERELIVRDMNKSANNEANVLFRGNTLLTKSLDTHMRRVGKEYLEASLGTVLSELNEKDHDCEVDPVRVGSHAELDRNRRRLLIFTQEVWRSLVAASNRCPIELRIVFRHIRACAEDRFGDFARNVSYTSVSGFLFLRFLCPAILNPKLFGLLKDDIKPRSRRTFTLMAKTIQNLANMVPAAGSKEPWMECMNPFLAGHRESFKSLIDDICFVPAPLPSISSHSSLVAPTYPPNFVSAERHLSYTTPTTIMQRLPPSSREGFPSLPYLIDQAKSFADLIHLWLEAIAALSNSSEAASLPGKTHADVVAAIHASHGDMKTFHQLCEALSHRTQECLIRAERAERPQSATSFQWEDVIDQLQNPQTEGGGATQPVTPDLTGRVAVDPLSRVEPPAIEATLAHLRRAEIDPDDEQHATRLYDPTPPRSRSPAAHFDIPRPSDRSALDQLGSASMPNSFGGNISRNWANHPGAASPVLSASASISNASSIMSSDTDFSTATTALPSYEREKRHKERRELARQKIQEQVSASREKKEKEKERDRAKMVGKLGSALRKKKLDRDGVATPLTNRSLDSSSSLHVNAD